MFDSWCSTVITQIQATVCDNMTQATGQEMSNNWVPAHDRSNTGDHFCDVEMILSTSHLTSFYMAKKPHFFSAVTP